MEEIKREKNIRKIEGVVVSDKMKNTAVVEVNRTKLHAKYQKYYNVKSRFKAHVEENGQYKVGDKVVMEETRPISKEKRWKIISKIN